MRKITTFIFIVLSIHLAISQHTERFNHVVSEQTPSRIEQIDKKFKNGKQKEIGILSVYEFQGYEYSFCIGKWTKFYKSGQILTEAEYDNFGNPILWKWYDGEGNLLRESKAIEIDTNSKTFGQFLVDKNSIDLLTYEKRYKYTFKACKWFLASEGRIRNSKKIGEWKKYYDEGKIKKVVEY